MHGSSRTTSLYLPLWVWWSAPPTSGVYPTGRPAIPATVHSSFLTALVGNPTCPWCPSQSWASPRNIPTLALGWAEGLGHLPPPLLWLNALRVLSGASCQRMSPLQACKRLCVSLAYAGLGTRHAPSGIYPEGSCGCGGIGIWCCWLLCLAFQYSIPKCGKHPMPVGVPPWLPGGPYHVSHPSLGSVNGVWFGSWAAEWPWQPPFGPLPAWWYLPLCRWLLKEDRMSLVAFFICWGPKGCRPGSLLSIYTLWKRPLISPQEVQYPTSWMAGTPASGSSLRRPCQQPQQISLSTSFCPDSVACTNIP